MLDAIDRSYDRFMKRLDPYLPLLMMVLLGIVMIVYGTFAFVIYSYDVYESINILILMASAVIVIQGIAIIFDPGRNYIRSTVIFAFSIGFFRLLVYYQNFLERIGGDVSVLKTADYFIAGTYLLLSALGLLMFVSAIAIQVGFAFRRNSLMTTCIIQMQTSTLYILYETVMSYDFMHLINDRMFQFKMCEFVLFMIVLYIFDSDEVRNGSTWGKHNIMMSDIRNGSVFDSNAYVLPVIAEEILDEGRGAWRDLMDCGPVEKEYSFTIGGRGYNQTEVIAQIWKGDRRVHLTAQMEMQTTLLFQKHMIADSVYERNGRLCFEGKDGTMMSFAIKEPTGEDRYAFLGTGA